MNIFLLLSRISILISTALVAGLPVKAQLSTVGVSGRKVSTAMQRDLQEPKQESEPMPQVSPASSAKREKGGTSSVQYNTHQPLLHAPLKRMKVTSGWGNRYHPISGAHHFHNGVDLEAYYELVLAVAPGRVKKVGFDKRSGLFIVLDHGQGITTSYAHLQDALAEVEQLVESGQPIGVSGNTGRSTAPHLHFSIKLYSLSVDPIALFK